MSCRVPASPCLTSGGVAGSRRLISGDVSVASHRAAKPVPRTEATCASLDHAHPFTSAQRVCLVQVSIRAFRVNPWLNTSRSNTMEKQLSAEEVRLLNAYWRAANYLSVGQIYLYDN